MCGQGGEQADWEGNNQCKYVLKVEILVSEWYFIGLRTNSNVPDFEL